MNAKPACIIVAGRPGSGKTTLAKSLAKSLWLPVVGRDAIKEGYVHSCGVRHDALPASANTIATDAFFAIVAHHLTLHISLVIEAAFQHPLWAARLPGIQAIGRPCFVICDLDGARAAQRHAERGIAEPAREYFHDDKGVAIFRDTGTLPPPNAWAAPHCDVPTIHVATADGYAPDHDEIVARIRTHLALT